MRNELALRFVLDYLRHGPEPTWMTCSDCMGAIFLHAGSH